MGKPQKGGKEKCFAIKMLALIMIMMMMMTMAMVMMSEVRQLWIVDSDDSASGACDEVRQLWG